MLCSQRSCIRWCPRCLYHRCVWGGVGSGCWWLQWLGVLRLRRVSHTTPNLVRLVAVSPTWRGCWGAVALQKQAVKQQVCCCLVHSALLELFEVLCRCLQDRLCLCSVLYIRNVHQCDHSQQQGRDVEGRVRHEVVVQVVGHFSRSRQGSGLRHRVVIVEEKEYNRRQNGGEVFVHIVLQASARKVSSLHASCPPNFALSALVFRRTSGCGVLLSPGCLRCLYFTFVTTVSRFTGRQVTVGGEDVASTGLSSSGLEIGLASDFRSEPGSRCSTGHQTS